VGTFLRLGVGSVAGLIRKRFISIAVRGGALISSPPTVRKIGGPVLSILRRRSCGRVNQLADVKHVMIVRLLGDAPGREHRLARLAQMQLLGDPVDEGVPDLELGQIAARKALVISPEPLGQLACGTINGARTDR
jgi:hypothetical protein